MRSVLNDFNDRTWNVSSELCVNWSVYANDGEDWSLLVSLLHKSTLQANLNIEYCLLSLNIVWGFSTCCWYYSADLIPARTLCFRKKWLVPESHIRFVLIALILGELKSNNEYWITLYSKPKGQECYLFILYFFFYFSGAHPRRNRGRTPQFNLWPSLRANPLYLHSAPQQISIHDPSLIETD